MKKITTLVACLCIMGFISCKKDVPPPPPEPIIIDNDVPPPPAPEAPTPPAEDENGTSIKVGKDGVDINTKNNSSKTTVKVKDGTGSVEVKK